MASARIANTPAQAYPIGLHLSTSIEAVDEDVYLSALGFTKDTNATHILLQVLDAPISATFDASSASVTPGAAAGFYYAAGKEAYLPMRMVDKMRIATATASTARLEIQQLGYII